MTGTVVNIQRFSTHDGPGIRTTVFLKGCSNSCSWCHNPETLSPLPELQTFPERCAGCGNCASVCPSHAHTVIDGHHEFERDLCERCGRCVSDCFTGALSISGRLMTSGSVLDEITADAAYYKHSGGGATFSGGEPVVQTSFLAELLAGCRREGVHTLVQTAANYSWVTVEPLLADIDTIMVDMKLWEPDLHARWVGSDPARIRENIRRFAQSGTPLIVRTPVVGGVNDDVSEIEAIARFVGSLDGVVYYEMIPYHALGNDKRASLGMPPAEAFHAPAPDVLATLAAVARRYVTDVRSGTVAPPP